MIGKDFEWIWEVWAYDDERNVSVDLFAAMNDEMSWTNDADDYCDENDDLSDCVSVIGNENDLETKEMDCSLVTKRNANYLGYCHCVFLNDYCCCYFDHYWND